MYFSSTLCVLYASKVSCRNANRNKVTRGRLMISLYEQIAAVFLHVETVCSFKGRAGKQNTIRSTGKMKLRPL
jgi:hypothetical protein